MLVQNQERELFSPPEVAAKWGMSVNTVLALVRSGKLPAVPLNLTGTRPRWKISREAMARFLENNSTKPVESAARSTTARPRKRHV
jgi:hypothetical protein